MRKLRCYTDQELQTDKTIELDEHSAHHLRTVLRASIGQNIEFFNGNGNNYDAELTAVTKKKVTAHIANCSVNPTQVKRLINLQQALIKPERMDWLIQKATELGVHQIQLLKTERVNFNLNVHRLEKKLKHWQNISISAAQQCGRSDIPVILTPISITELPLVEDQNGVVLHPYTQKKMVFPKHQEIHIAIGPEGGFTDDEIQKFNQLNYTETSLDGYILRAETAAITSINLAMLYG